MMTHEGIHTDTEQVGYAGQPDDRGVGHHARRQPDAGQGDHAEECRPPHDGGQDLEVLGLGHVEEDEGADDQGEPGEEDAVGVEAGHPRVVPAGLGLGDVVLGVVGRYVGARDVAEGLGDGGPVDGQVAVQVDRDAQVEQSPP